MKFTDIARLAAAALGDVAVELAHAGELEDDDPAVDVHLRRARAYAQCSAAATLYRLAASPPWHPSSGLDPLDHDEPLESEHERYLREARD